MHEVVHDQVRSVMAEYDPKKVYWLSPVGGFDDFDDPIKDEIIDGKTQMGPWALMTPKSYAEYGIGRLGTGFGQRYKLQSDGKWLKIEG
jgi:hypothetical protein